MQPSLPEDPKSNRRGCIGLTVAAVLFLLLAVAIGSGWLGKIEKDKAARIVPVAGNRS